MNPETPSFVPDRRLRTGFSVLLATVSLFAILVMVNYLAVTRPAWRYDLTARDSLKLSPLTLQTLAALTNEMKVTVLFDVKSDLFPHVSSLLREYSAQSRLLRIEIIDPLRNPSLAEAKKREYRLGSRKGDVVIFEAGGHVRVVPDGELSIYNQDDIQSLVAGRETEIRRSGFTGENRFTSAIAALLEDAETHAAYLTGHGEHPADSEDEQTGYGSFMRLLTGEKNLRVEAVNLATNDLPAEVQLLIIAGPVSPLLPVELKRIQAFLERGGRLLVGLHPYAVDVRTGLEELLFRWSIYCPPKYAGEGDRNLVPSGADLVAKNFGTHPLMLPLRRGNGSVYFPLPRVVAPVTPDRQLADALKADVLVMTSEKGLTKSDIAGANAAFDPRQDRQNVVVPLAVAAEKGGVSGVAAGRGTTRIVVVGDSNVFKNDTIDQASNRDFAALCVSWLLDRPQALAIGPKAINEWRVQLAEPQLDQLRWLLLGALPGSVLLLGLVVWYRRRA